MKKRRKSFKSSKLVRLSLAQNRIDYIVYSNPQGAAQLIDQYGYEPLQNPKDLVRAIKKLIQRKGQKAIKELIKIHPDRNAILKVQRGKEDNYCGACSSYSYNPEDNYCGVCGHSQYLGESDRVTFLNQLVDLDLEDLEAYYQNTLRKANASPDNQNLAREVEMVWNELRLRKHREREDKKANKESKVSKEVQTVETPRVTINAFREELVVLGLVFVAGILVGSSFSTGFNLATKSALTA